MKKNLILTMLACLNCVHTTHAVEPMSANTQMQEILDKLKQQYNLQKLRMLVGRVKGDVEMLRDAAIQKEEIVQKAYAHKKDTLPLNDPVRGAYEVLIAIRSEIVEDLRNLQADDSKAFARVDINQDIMFDNKIKEWIDSGNITGLDVVNPMQLGAYKMAVQRAVPGLPLLDEQPHLTLGRLTATAGDLQDLIHSSQDVQTRANQYQDIGPQKRDLYREMWVHELNSGIKKGYQWIANIGDVIRRLDESDTEIGRDIKETILNTLRDNLFGEDQDLKANTKRLLEQAQGLTQMVFDGPETQKMLAERMVDPTMPLLKMRKHKEKATGPLKKVQGPVFREMLKY